MSIVIKVFILAIVQGFCELLPVSSSAHVIIAEKLMGLDPTAPSMTFLLVMLHTGTMLAVIAYFWNTWRSRYFSSAQAFWPFARSLCLATLCTAIVGFGLMVLIEHVILRGAAKAEMEQLFGNTTLIAVALASVGVLIITSGLRASTADQRQSIGPGDAGLVASQQPMTFARDGGRRQDDRQSEAVVLQHLFVEAAKQPGGNGRARA